MIIQQFLALAQALPGLISEIQKYGLSGLRLLDEAGYLPRSPQETISSLREDLTNAARVIGSNTLGGLVGYLSGTFSFALSLFGILFVAAYLLADVRTLKASYLLAIPVSYRRDALVLWDAVGYSLSRYLSGLALILTIQGVLSAVALYLLGVPYSLVLGAWVSATAIIPLLGAWLGAIPGVIVAFTVSPLTGFLTILLFLVIQQLEGNFLTPRIQGQVLRVHPILIFLAVIVGGGLGGILGVLIAVPTLAVLKVLFDFLRFRLRTDPADERSHVSQATVGASVGRLPDKEEVPPVDPG